MNYIYKIIITFLSLFIIFSLYIIFNIFLPIRDFPEGQAFYVEKGETGHQIFTRLEENGYINDVFWAKVVTKIFGFKKFYRGEYVFERPYSTYQIIYQLTKRPPSYAVLIPPGFTKKQIAERLSKYIRRFDKKDFLEKAEEGYLYPDTYYFYSYATVDEVLEIFKNKFYQESFETFGKVPTKEQVIIASMIEREVRDPEEMKMVASVMYNRLKINMPLQIDSTVLYGQGAWKDRVLYSDLKHESDYNTYVNTGLPIGPISNPGLDSLKAAIKPARTDYLYYLTGRDGVTYFAKTHEEHVKNKAKYLR